MPKKKEEDALVMTQYEKSDGNPPVERRAGQTIKEMSDQLIEAYKDSKLMSPVANKEISEQMRQARIMASIEQKRQMLMQMKERGKVDLGNYEEVELTLNNYLSACEEAGVIPNFLGFCAAMGYTRRNLSYAIEGHIKHADRRAMELVEAARVSFAAVLAEAALNRAVSEPTAIFLLKNTGQGLTDRQEISFQAADPFSEDKSSEEIKDQYKDIIIE